MQGQVEQYLKILREGTSSEVEEYFGDAARAERLQIFCALAAYHTAAGRAEQDRVTRNEHFARAAQLLGKARQIDYNEQLPALGQGQLALARVGRPWPAVGKTCGGMMVDRILPAPQVQCVSQQVD